MTVGNDELLTRAVGGDSDALALVLRACADRLRRSLDVGRTHQASLDVDDVVQVTYLEAFLRIGQCRARTMDAFLGWLMQMARNNLRDAVKELERHKRPDPHRRVHPTSDDGSSAALLTDLMGATSTTGSRLLARKETRELLDVAITRLPDTYQRVVRLYDLEEQSPQQVAQAIGRSVGAVHLLRLRAHARLRELLGSESKFLSDGA